MAANGANDAAVRGFLYQLLHSIVRQIENNDGRGENGDGVLYRVDWLYNVLFAIWEQILKVPMKRNEKVA